MLVDAVPYDSLDLRVEHLLPERGLDYRVARRIAGLGSLGRMRLVAIAECNGGKVAREAKAMVPSSVHWLDTSQGPSELMYQTIINRAVRSETIMELCGAM